MNLAQLLNLERPLIVLDCETDGVSDGSRIVEIGHQVHRPDGSIMEWRTLVNPGRPISPETTAIHNISDEMVQGCRECDRPLSMHRGEAMSPGIPTRHCEGFKPWPSFIHLALNLARGYSNCDFAGKNVRFDLGILAGEFRRAKVEWGYAGARILDADRLEALGEPRDLSTLYKRRTGRDPVDAHSALADVRMTTELIVAQLEAFEKLPHSLAKLHELSWPGWIDTEGKIRKGKDGVVRVQFGKHRGSDVLKVDPSYWTWVMKSDFSPEFKALCGEMATGRFPK